MGIYPRPYRRDITDANEDIIAVTIDMDRVRVQTNADRYPSSSAWMTPAQARQLIEALGEALLVYAELYDEPAEPCTCPDHLDTVPEHSYHGAG